MEKKYFKFKFGKHDTYVLFESITKVMVKGDKVLVYCGTGLGREGYEIKEEESKREILAYVGKVTEY